MAKLQLGIAIGDYDRIRPLVDGTVTIDGVNPQWMLDPEEIFFRAFRHADFDICELSLSSTCVKMAAGDCSYVGVPVFPSRAFRHTSIYVRTDRIKRPSDLRGKTGRRAGTSIDRQRLGTAHLGGGVRRHPRRHHLGPRRLRAGWPGGEDRARLACRCAIGKRAGRCHDLGRARVRRARRGDRPARAIMLRARRSSHRLPVRRSARGGGRLVLTDPAVPDHAPARRPPHARRRPSVAPCGGGQGVRAVEGAWPSANSVTPRPAR